MTPTEQRPQECEYCVDNHCQHPYYNDCDCASWSWCDHFTPKPRKMENNQTPSECKYWCDGKCGLTPTFMQTDRGLTLNVWCRGANCPDYQPKEKKDGKE